MYMMKEEGEVRLGKTLGGWWGVARVDYVGLWRKFNRAVYVRVKRVLDFALAAVLLVPCAPIFVLVAVAIKLDPTSGGGQPYLRKSGSDNMVRNSRFTSSEPWCRTPMRNCNTS